MPGRGGGASSRWRVRRFAVCHHGRVTETFYERVGGRETFRLLVERFYEGVAEDAPLRELYPEQDLGPAAERLQLFLE
ncbi:MAG: hypothetical protein KIT69_07700, partial [Propionibacteriaceae bacterium]|nr:hypothetical protein [Propionibacteriaceae bacterium]